MTKQKKKKKTIAFTWVFSQSQCLIPTLPPSNATLWYLNENTMSSKETLPPSLENVFKIIK